jgi:hypothetical protein
VDVINKKFYGSTRETRKKESMSTGSGATPDKLKLVGLENLHLTRREANGTVVTTARRGASTPFACKGVLASHGFRWDEHDQLWVKTEVKDRTTLLELVRIGALRAKEVHGSANEIVGRAACTRDAATALHAAGFVYRGRRWRGALVRELRAARRVLQQTLADDAEAAEVARKRAEGEDVTAVCEWIELRVEAHILSIRQTCGLTPTWY